MDNGQHKKNVKKRTPRSPSTRWFESNGTPIKKATVSADKMASLADEDLDIIALSTRPIVDRRVMLVSTLMGLFGIFAVLTFISLGLYIYGNDLWDDSYTYSVWSNETLTVIFAAFSGAVVLLGMFLTPFCYKAIKGFLTINGAERLGLSGKYARTLRFFCRVSHIWGIVIIGFRSLANKRKSKKHENPIQLALPEHCGYDDIADRHTKEPKARLGDGDTDTDELHRRNKNGLKAAVVQVRNGEDLTLDFSRRARRRKTVDPYPGKKWFKQNDTPIREINIHYQVLLDMSDDEKDLISVSSYALVKTRLKLITAHLIILAIGLVLLIAGIMLMASEADIWVALDLLFYGVLIFGGSLVVGAFLMTVYYYPMLAGFLYIDGPERLGLDRKYAILIKVYEKISLVWGIIGIMILSYMGAFKNSKAEFMLHVGIPENCGYDKMIDLYRTAAQASLDDILNALQQTANEKEYERFKQNQDKLIEEIKADKRLTEKEKAEAQAEQEEKQKEAEEKYSAAQTALKEDYEQNIKPVQEQANQIADGDDFAYSTSEIASTVMMAQIGSYITDAVVSNERPYGSEARVATVEKRNAAANICLTATAVSCFIAGIVSLFVTYGNETFGSIWGAVLIPFLVSGALAAAEILVYVKTHGRNIFGILSFISAALFACFLLIVPISAAVDKFEYYEDENSGGSNVSIPPVSDETYFDYVTIYYGQFNPEIAITGYHGDPTDIVIPSAINGIPVKYIRYKAFSGCSELTSITIPNSVTSIEGHAFEGCSGLTSITIPNSVTIIEDSAFSGCSSLTSITIPNSVTTVGSEVFSECNSLTVYCKASSKPNDWSYLWFGEHYDLSSMIVWDCDNNDKDENGYAYTVANGIRYALKNGIATVTGQPSNIVTANIPSNVYYKNKTYPVIGIALRAFAYCEALTDVVIANGVTSIGNDAFYHCTGLTSITIPNSVTSIGEWAFYYCSGLTSITFNGTKAQWLAIEKGSNWNGGTGDYVIHCTNGDIQKS